MRELAPKAVVVPGTPILVFFYFGLDLRNSSVADKHSNEMRSLPDLSHRVDQSLKALKKLGFQSRLVR